MAFSPDPALPEPIANDPEKDHKSPGHKSASTKEAAIDEKGSISPDTKDVAEGELVVIDNAGHVDVIRESDYTPEEYKKLLRKIDRFLLPLMWFCYGVQQTDKTSLGTQAIFGLIDDTHLVGQQYSWLTTIFYITYLCGEFPSNFLLQRWSIGKSLSLYMMGWGICIISISAAQDWSQLMALRALQGFFECTISPGFLMVIATWYRREEHPNRALWWQSANAGFGIIASLINFGIGSNAKEHAGTLAPWRCISLFLGSCTIVLSIICFFLLGSPKEVIWMNKDEKRMAAARIVRNKVGRDVTGVKWTWPQVWEAAVDPQLWFCMINAFLSSVANGYAQIPAIGFHLLTAI